MCSPAAGLLQQGQDPYAFDIKEAIKERSPDRIEEVLVCELI